MSCSFLDNEIDSMFDNEPNDIHNDALLSSKLWNSDNLSMTSNDIYLDPIFYDDLPSNSFDLIHDKSKDKLLDFDYNLLECNDLLETTKNSIKLEPTHTNSVSSSYLTDDASPTSSNHNSPIGRKVRKREFHTIDSSSEKSFALYEEPIEHPPAKSANFEIIKKESIQQNPRTIYKLSRDSKLEPREPFIINNVSSQRQIVKVRPGTATPYIVSGSIKSVNISKYPQEKHYDGPSRNSNFLTSTQNSYSPILDQDCDLLTGDYYDHEVDLYSDYKPRVGSYINHNVFNGSNSQHSNNSTIFQTPIPQTGTLYLTDEEKRTLLQENYSIPTRVPLTKQEERNLKKVRRKIKNKLSAQESRRKKKEYVDALEKKVEAYEQERIESKRRIETLENQQRTLQNQIRHYQHQMMNKVTGPGNTTSTGLMLFMICFALILVGGSMPSSYRKMNLPQSSLISSSALYYMGYGPSRTNVNNSDIVLMHHHQHVRDKPHKSVNRPLEIVIVPRQSILLGEDNDDRNFEELVFSYSKSNKKICGGNNHRMGGSSVDMVKNESSIARWNVMEDIVIGGGVSNMIELVK